MKRALRTLPFLSIVLAYGCGSGNSTGDASTGPSPTPVPVPPPFQPLALPLTDRIAFTSNRADTLGDVFVANLDGSDARRLTGNESGDFCPVVSPDGNWIAYLTKPAQDSSGRLYILRGPNFGIMRADGSDKKIIKRGYPIGGAFCPVWSRDSDQVIFIETSESLIRTPTGAYVRIFSPDLTLLHAFGLSDVNRLSISRDGSRLAYGTRSQTLGPPIDFRLVSIDLDGHNSVDLAAGSIPDWSPTDQRLAYSCDAFCVGAAATVQVKCAGICLLNADGTAPTQVTSMTGTPVFSPDGVRIAFRCNESSLCIIAVNGSAPSIPVSSGVRGSPVWSSDGKALAFDCGASTSGICIVNSDGSNLRNLTQTGVSESNPSFAPISIH